MSNIKQIKQVSIKDNKLKATIEVYNERTADSYQTSYQNECPIHEEFTLAMANLNFHVEKICGTCFPGRGLLPPAVRRLGIAHHLRREPCRR